MDAFATVEDLEARWRELTDAEKSRAESLLADASTVIRAEFARNAAVIDPYDEVQAATLTLVCCSMAQRIMAVEDDVVGAKQVTQTAGSYSLSRTYNESAGVPTLWASERRMLGLRRQRIAAVRGEIHGRPCHDLR